MRLRLASRSSDLARIQAYQVAETLKKLDPKIEIELQFRESLGDKNLIDPLWKVPEKGVFTSDFTQDLLESKTDMVVHSWKDLPTEGSEQTLIAATLPRADQRDLLLFKKSSLHKKNIKIFSSSLRREYNLQNNLKELLPFAVQNIDFTPVRGNILTRIKKLSETEDVDALIVAKAALDRLLTADKPEFLNMQTQIRGILKTLHWMALPLEINPNAAAQGALAIEIRSDNKDLKKLLQQINDAQTFACAQGERDILSKFGGGCHQKIGIAVLKRDYGQILFLKGKTDDGQILDEKKLSTSDFKFAKDSAWSSSSLNLKAQRKALNFQLPSSCNALFVSKADAWSESLKNFSGVIWASGIKTWKKLAAQGVWVHGSSEGLGEKDLIDVQFVPEVLSWCKLTHAGTNEQGDSSIATYSVELESSLDLKNLAASLEDKKVLFWSSGTWFKLLTESQPELLKKIHCCGPGNTYKTIQKTLESHGISTTNIKIFLSENEWNKNNE